MELGLTRGLYIASLKTSIHFGIIWFKENLTKRLNKMMYQSFGHSSDFGNPPLLKYRMEVWISVANYENSKRTVRGQLRK